MLAILHLIDLKFLRSYPHLKPHILFYSNGPAIWHGLSDIRHIKVNYGRQSTILNLIEFKFFRAYPYLKPDSLFHSDGLAIWHGWSDNRHIKVNYINMAIVGHFESNGVEKVMV